MAGLAAVMMFALWGAPLARALSFKVAGSKMACCRKKAHACCKRKASGNQGAAWQAQPACGERCASIVSLPSVPLTEIARPCSSHSLGEFSLLLSAAGGSGHATTELGRALDQRPPPSV